MANQTPPKGRTRPAAPTTSEHGGLRMPDPPREIDLDPDDESEAPYAGASQESGPQQVTPRVAMPKHGNRVVEPQDLLRDDPERRRENARRRRAKEIEHNPFLDDDEPAMPRLPADDDEWAYKWIRHMISGQDDRKNVQASVAGRLSWEYFTLEEVPNEDDQRRLRSLVQIEGRFGGNIVYNDCVAMRTSRHMRDLKRAAEDHRATQQIQATRRQFTNARDAERLGTWVEEDKTQVVELLTT